MRKSSSKNLHQKNKTLSTVLHSEHEQKTTKKCKINKTASCNKMPITSIMKSSKTSLIKANVTQTTDRNDILVQQNIKLREQYCKLQDLHLKDKQKIKILLGRISKVKQQNLTRHQTPKRNQTSNKVCQDSKCKQKRKYLQLELYKQRIKVGQLEKEKNSWEKNKLTLKSQYKDLLSQIQFIREKS